MPRKRIEMSESEGQKRNVTEAKEKKELAHALVGFLKDVAKGTLEEEIRESKKNKLNKRK